MAYSYTFRVTFDLPEDPDAFAHISTRDIWDAFCRAYPLCRMSAILVESCSDCRKVITRAGGNPDRELS